MIDVAAAAHASTVQVTVTQADGGTHFVCGVCSRVSESWPLDVTVALVAGHLLSHLEPDWLEGETN